MKNLKSLIYSILMLCASHSVVADDLISLYNQALSADPSLKLSEFRVAIGEAQRGQAGGALLPQINANVNLSLNDRTPKGGDADGYKGERYNVNLTQSLLDLPKYWEWDRTKEVVKQYEAENRDAGQNLILDVVERYFTALEAGDEYFLFQQEKRSTEQQLKQLKQQYKKQIIKITDVLEIEARLNGLEADEIQAETVYIIAKEGLTELTGEKVGTLATLKPEIDFKPIEGDLELWIKQARESNPALQATQQAISAALSDVSLQNARHLPVVDAQLTYYSSNTGFESAQTPETETLVAAININIPIFSGGTTRKRADEATYKLAITKQENIAKLREVIRQTRDSFLSTNASLRRIKAATKALESSTKSKHAMEKGFKYGVQTISDILISQSREFRSKKELLQAKYSYIKNRVRFMRALGMINADSLRDINRWLVVAEIPFNDAH